MMMILRVPFLVLLALRILHPAVGDDQAVVIPEKESFHLYLLAGQSNMAGRGKISIEDTVVHPRVLTLTRDGEWKHAIDPIHFDKPAVGVGLGRTFGILMAEATPGVTIGLIPCAAGGSPISTWQPGGYHDQTDSHPYDDCVKRAKIAMQSGTLKAILWHQGESDSTEELSEQYGDKLHELIARLRRNLDTPDVPFIVGQMGQFTERPWSNSKKLVDLAHRSLPDKISRTAFVSSDELDHMGDEIHFNSEAYRELGRRYAVAYQTWLTSFQEEVQHTDPTKLTSSLTFYTSFDSQPIAEFAKGDPRLYRTQKEGTSRTVLVGLPSDGTTIIEADKGVSGGAIRFTKKDPSRVFFYKAQDNLVYREQDWQGTVSFWLSLHPEVDLEPGYCDPIQITPRQWNDAAFFVDFDKEGDPREFRLGAFADLKVWNPEGADVPESQRPLLPVRKPPFGRDQWTHVAFTWSGFNRGDDTAEASLYLNGESQGKITGWNQQFTWRADEESQIQIGLNYIGLFDELACFDRALSDGEIAGLFQLKGGLRQMITSSQPSN